MATPHISAETGDIAPAVLMPGDPKRAERIAKDFLDAPRLVSDVRGIGCWTGTYQGRPMSVMASGMGVPSLCIYATELFRFYGVQRIARVGTCGAMSHDVKVRDVVIATAAHTNSSMPGLLVPGATVSFAPSFNLLKAASLAAEKVEGVGVHYGPVYTSDHFYGGSPETVERLVQLGTLGVEMESTGLFGTAMVEGREALTVLTASDHLLDPSDDMTADERETSYAAMVQIAAKALVS